MDKANNKVHYSLGKKSNIILERFVGQDKSPVCVIRSWVPESFFDKETESLRLRPSEKAVYIPVFYLDALIEHLTTIRGKSRYLKEPCRFFTESTDAYVFPDDGEVVFPSREREQSKVSKKKN